MTQRPAACDGRDVTGVTTAMVLLAGGAAWVATILWARSRDMKAMPGTMRLGLPLFVAMWALMMAAMMLPSVWPFIGVYARTVRVSRGTRLTGLTLGYLLVWALTGLAAYGLARVFGHLAAERRNLARATAVATFTALGLYQLTPLKARCLSHCRSPLAHLFHYASFRGPLRDVRAGVSHGAFCLGCCWALMVVLVAFGVMNIPAMISVALVIALEKTWRYGERLARAVGVGALIYAAALLIAPSLAPGLDPGPVSDTGGTPMSTMPHGMGPSSQRRVAVRS